MHTAYGLHGLSVRKAAAQMTNQVSLCKTNTFGLIIYNKKEIN